MADFENAYEAVGPAEAVPDAPPEPLIDLAAAGPPEGGNKTEPAKQPLRDDDIELKSKTMSDSGVASDTAKLKHKKSPITGGDKKDGKKGKDAKKGKNKDKEEDEEEEEEEKSKESKTKWKVLLVLSALVTVVFALLLIFCVANKFGNFIVL